MKYILFLYIMVGLSCFDTNSQEGMTASEIAIMQIEDKPDRCIYISDLLQYQQECHRDSFFYVSWPEGKEVWNHREATLEGFINWIKTRQ